MPLDDRVKGYLERSSQIVDPDIRRDLATVRRRTRRLAIRQRVGYTLLAAAVIAGALFVAPGVLDVIRSQRQRPATNAPHSALAGTYNVDLSGAGGPLVPEGLAGRWTMTFNGDGSIVWTGPPGAGAHEALPRDTFHADGDSIVTNLFANSLCRGEGVGTYVWLVESGDLSFVVETDTCELRRLVLTSATWSFA